ncbi:MAG TPA: hypothetical protein VFS00_07855 [Polyangiaceae bacterium]|nr:hypothetical protein [Polyangiaceae bacterium]
MRELFRSAHFLVELDEANKVLFRRRTERGYTSAAEIEAAYEALFSAVEPFHRPEYGLLSDLRLAPPRNDPTFERAVGRYHVRFYSHFHKIAHVVLTEAGRLQIARLAQPDVARRLRVFTSEAMALEFLTNPRVGLPVRQGFLS